MGPLAIKKQGKGERGKGKGKDMVRCANQSFVVRFAHGLLPALVLKMVLRRWWLYLSDRDLYSRLHVDVNLRTRESVYSRPRAGSRGAQRSPLDVRNPVERISSISSTSFQVAIVQALPGVGRVPERSEGGWVLNRSFNSPVKIPIKNRRCLSSATFPQSEIRNPQSENRNCLNP